MCAAAVPAYARAGLGAVLFQFSRIPQFITVGAGTVKGKSEYVISVIARRLFVNRAAKLQIFLNGGIISEMLNC